MMTLVDVKNALLSFFITCSTFSLKDDLGSIKLLDKEDQAELEVYREAVIKHALEDLVKINIVAHIGDGVYVLSQPISQLNQSVIVTPITALMIADLINSFHNNAGGADKMRGYKVNKLGITDGDIAMVCSICHTILSSDFVADTDNEEGDKGPPKGKSKKP